MKLAASHKMLLGLFGLLALFPDVASAATDAFTVYAYGSGNVLRQIFSGMKGIVDDAGYRMMILTLLLLTMIFALTKGYLFGKPSAMPIVGLILGAFAVQIFVLSDASTVDIHIEDQVNAEDYLVEDVPLVMAGAAALTSEMSRYMVKLVEAFYMGSLPPDMLISNNNTYNFANKIAAGMRDIAITEPMTKATFNSYVRDCVVPEMYQGRIQLDELMNGKPENFWGTIKANNRARMSMCFQQCKGIAAGDSCAPAECPNPYSNTAAASLTPNAKNWREGMMVPCPDGHAALEARITGMIGATAFNRLGNTMLRDTSLLDGVISSTLTHVTGVTGATGSEHFVRAGMMNMFRESSANVISNGGGEGLIQVMGIEQAKAVQRSNWMVAAEVFSESVAYLWAALQAFIFAIFPVAIMLFLFPGLGGKAMAGYFGLIAWISLWMPFLAIINYLSISWLVEDIRQLAMEPMSYGALIMTSDAGSNMQAITNFLGTMVPVLTYGMVRGGEFALTSFVENAGSAPQVSQSAAKDIAGKSYSYGSIAANNVGMNKFDSTTSMAIGYDAVTSKEGAGSLTSLRPESIAATTKAGALQTVTDTVTESGKRGESGSTGAAASQSVSADVANASQMAYVAKQAASSGATSTSQKSALLRDSESITNSLDTAWQQSLTNGLSASNTSSSRASFSGTGQATISGVAVMGATLGLIGAATGGRAFEANGGAAAVSFLKDKYGAESGVMSGLNASLEANGSPFRFQSENEAVAYVNNVADTAAAVREKTGASNSDVVAMMQASGLAPLASSTEGQKDLAKLEQQGSLTARGKEFLKDHWQDLALGAAMLVPGLGLAAGGARAGLMAYRAYRAGEAISAGAKIAGAAVAGGAVVAASSVGDAEKSSESSKPGGRINWFDADGSQSATARMESSVEGSSGATSGITSGSGSRYSSVLSQSHHFDQAAGVVHASANSIAATLEASKSNSSGTSFRLSADGTMTWGYLTNASTETSGSRSRTSVMGDIDAAATLVDSPVTGSDAIAQIRTARDQVRAYQNNTEAKAADPRGAVRDMADKEQLTPALVPNVPALPPSALTSTAASVRNASAPAPALGSVPDATIPGGHIGIGHRQAAQETDTAVRTIGGFASVNADAMHALDAAASNVRRTAGMSVMSPVPIGTRDGIDASSIAGEGVRAMVASVAPLNQTLGKSYPGLSAAAAYANGSVVLQMRDDHTGAAFTLGTTKDGGRFAIEGSDSGLGNFLRGPNAGYLVSDPSGYRKLSSEEAVARYRAEHPESRSQSTQLR